MKPVALRYCLASILSLIGWCDLEAAEVRILVDDHSALQARLELIQNASETLNIAWFELSDDQIGQLLTKTLAEASRRGVSVRLVIDAMHDHTSINQRDQLREHGVQIRWFHPIGTGAANLMCRMHDKYLSADGEVLIVGSRNIANSYFGLSDEKPNFNDIDVKLSGDFVAGTTGYFEALWVSSELGTHRRYKKTARLQKDSTRPLQWENTISPKQVPESGPITEQRKYQISDQKLTFLHDENGRKSQANGIHRHLHAMIASARDSIVIVSPYFYPTTELITILTRAKNRGVQINILTNSIKSSNRPINQVALDSLMRRRLKQIPIKQYQGKRTLHAKGVIVDGKLACITSYNFNHRSQYFDTELALLVEDQTFARALQAEFEKYFQGSAPYTPINRLNDNPPTLTEKRLRQFRWLARLIPRHL